MITLAPALQAVGGARRGIAPVNLLDVQDINGNFYYWADRAIKAPPVNAPDIMNSVYRSAAFNTSATPSCSVMLAVNAGDLILALASADGYGVAPPSIPAISDDQSNAWTTDASFLRAYVGGTGSGFLLAHAIASATGNVTVTVTGPAGFASRLLLVQTNAIGIDAAAISTVAIAGASVTPTANASAADEWALVLDFEGVNEWTADKGTELFTTHLNSNFAHVWQFAASQGANSCTLSGGQDNFSVGAIVLLKGTVITVTDPLYASSVAPQQYTRWVQKVPEFSFNRSLVTDVGSFVLQNLSGDTVARDFEKILRRSTLEGAMFVWRMWQPDAAAAWLEVHGTLSVEDIGDSTVSLRGGQLTNAASGDGSIECFTEGCQLQWAKARCGSTQPTECTYSVQTCQVIERIMAFPNSFEKNYGETLANISEQNQNRLRRI